MNIIRAGGSINGLLHTNSVEAVEKYLRLGENFIELECLEVKDGWVFAHPGSASKFYELAADFSEVKLNEFDRLRVATSLTPLTLARLEKISNRYPRARFIIGVHAKGRSYEEFCNWFSVRARPEFLSRLVPQVYCERDLVAVRRAGFQRYLLALWRYFDDDPFGDSALDLIRGLHADQNLFGLAVRYKNPKTGQVNSTLPSIDRVLELIGLNKIYIHGQESSLTYAAQVLFEPVYRFFTARSLADVHQGFNPEVYRNLNADLVNMTIPQVTAHYIEFGRAEGRRTSYALPADFSAEKYLEINPDVAKNQAPAAAEIHWTKFGAKEGRRYK